MSQYFSRLAARSGVAQGTPSRSYAASMPNESVAWGEQNTELVLGSTALVGNNTTPEAASSSTETSIASASPREALPTKIAFENKRNTEAAAGYSDAAKPANLTVTSSAIDSMSTPSISEKRLTSVSASPQLSHFSDRAAPAHQSTQMQENNDRVEMSSSASSRLVSSVFSEPADTSNTSSFSPYAKQPITRKTDAGSLAQKKLSANTADATQPDENDSPSSGRLKNKSRPLEPIGNAINTRISSRPQSMPEVAEFTAQPSSRSSTQVHIGKIELEIHAAPQKAQPVPVQTSPAPAATTKRSAGFNASRHYLRSR